MNRDRVEKFVFLVIPQFIVEKEIKILKRNATMMRKLRLKAQTH